LGDTYYTFDIPDDLLRISLGTNYVKLSGGIMSYSIESGQFMNMNVNLDTLKGTSHAIQTTDTGYKSLNGQKIKEFLSDKNNGFMKKVLDSGGVLANLYKAYFTSLTDKSVTDQEVEKEFGEDLEGKDKNGQDIKDWKGNVVEPWSINAKPYEAFKTEMKIKIKESLDDKNNHRMFGLDSETVQTLETRPLEITNAIPVQSGRLLDIFSEIDTNDTLKILFTNLSKNWWTAEELVPFNRTKIEVYDEKRERLDSCYKKEYLRSCGGD
jgi:predicted DNA-binding ArsR family transcriptional regulator